MKPPHSVRDARKPGWFYLDGALITRYGPQIGAYGIAIYAVLAHKAAESRSDCAIIGYDSIAALISIGRNTVIRTLRDMATAGVITIEQQTDDMGRAIGANIYTLCSIVGEQKAVSPHGGVPTQGTPVPTQGTPHAREGTGGYPHRDGGGTHTGIRHDQYHIESDSNTPPPTRAVQKNGGGGDSYETEVRQLLGGYNILGAAKVATKYAALDTRPPLDAIRAAVLSMANSDPNTPNRIYRRLMDSAPPWPELRAAAKSAPIQATRPNLPEATVAPAEMLRQLRERR